MDDLMDMLVSGESSPAEVSDKIKEILYTKASDKVDSVKPQIAGSIFGDEEPNEVVDEVESEEDEEETQTGDEE
tara:strand:+ start:166 stop:387 length:222 start_codon:yes stop_codon:yes gene_type:complete